MCIRGTLKELSLEIILGNGNCQIYCWNLNRLCTSRDYTVDFQMPLQSPVRFSGIGYAYCTTGICWHLVRDFYHS